MFNPPFKKKSKYVQITSDEGGWGFLSNWFNFAIEIHVDAER